MMNPTASRLRRHLRAPLAVVPAVLEAASEGRATVPLPVPEADAVVAPVKSTAAKKKSGDMSEIDGDALIQLCGQILSRSELL